MTNIEYFRLMVLGAFVLAGIGLWQGNFVIGIIGVAFACLALW